VSRVVASGEHTNQILRKIKQTTNLKLIRGIDFDPYLCEDSSLRPLSEVLLKLKRPLDRLILIFRRFVVKDELKMFSSFLARHHQLKTLRVDFPNPQGIDTQDVKCLEDTCREFVCLKDVDIGLSGSKNVTKNISNMQGLFRNSAKIEKLKSHVYFYHIEPSPFDHFKRKPKRKRFFKNLKSFSMKFAFKTAWASYYDGTDPGQGFHNFFRAIPFIANPVHFSLTSLKMQMPLEVLKALGEMLPLLTNLRFVFLELNNIKLSEFELMVLAKGFVDCKQIQHLTFKYMDNVPLPAVDLLQFIVIMSKFSVFPKFDLFFRKLSCPEWQTPHVKQKLGELGNIKYVLTKQSIHIQKIEAIEADE